MSNRSLIEINHDLIHKLDDQFLDDLRRYVNSASRKHADELLKWSGVRVIGMRHHSGNFILDGTPDGFPVTYLVPAKAGTPDAELGPGSAT